MSVGVGRGEPERERARARALTQKAPCFSAPDPLISYAN